MSVGKKLLTYFIAITAFSLIASGIAWFSSDRLQSEWGLIVSDTLPSLMEAYALAERMTALTTKTSALAQIQNAAEYL